MSKKLFVIVLLLTSVLGKDLMAQNMMYYTSETYNYTIQLPEDWKRSDEISSEQVALVMLSDEGAVISISFYKMNGLNHEDFIDRFEKSLPGNYENLELQEKGVLKSRDDEATYLVYDYSKDGSKFKEKVCFYYREGEMVVITANSDEHNFHNSLPIFDKIFRSFTFETNQEKIEE